MVKRRRKCGGCGSCFHRIDAHHVRSPECAGPCPAGSVPASHPTDPIHDLEDDTLVHQDQELPDDLPALLSTNNSTTAENDSSSQPMDVDDDDLCEMFIADCNTPSLSLIPLPLASAGSQSNPANSPVLATTSLPDQPTGVAPPVGLESGRAFSVQPDHQKARHCFTNQDRSLMKLHHMFDEADSPRCLCDKVLAQLKEEMTRHNFEPNNPLLNAPQVSKSTSRGGHGAAGNTLLSSEERVGALLALVLLLQTDEGQAILEDTFSPGFDARRMSRAAQFLGGCSRNNNNNEDMEPDDEANDEADNDDETETADDDIDLTQTAGAPRVAIFRPTHCNIHFVCAQIGRHDLSFLHQDVFPNLPARHVLECMKSSGNTLGVCPTAVTLSSPLAA
jgi:hypothetical protein